MLKEYYENLSSIIEERFYLEDDLSKQILSTARDPVCLNIINCLSKNPPMECSHCQQVFCSQCKDKLLISDSKCPQCREILNPKKLNRNLKCILENLRVKCQFNLNGCAQLLSFERLVYHEEECQYKGTSCELSCGFYGLVKDLSKHKRECDLAFVNCKYKSCQYSVCRKEIANHEKQCMYKTDSKENMSKKILKRIHQTDSSHTQLLTKTNHSES